MDDVSRSPLDIAHVEAVLQIYGLSVTRLTESASTAPLAAATLNTTTASIVKSVLFMVDGRPVLVLAGGDLKVDKKRLARDVGGQKARIASAEEVTKITGYKVGGVPPLAHLHAIDTLFDRHLLQHETVYAAAGSPYTIFAVEPHQLLEITQAKLTDCVQ